MLARILSAGFAIAIPGLLAAQNVAEVQVAPPSVTIRIGERSGLLATAFDRIGNVIPTARFVWSSNNVNVARVDNNGTVTGVGGGVAIIDARVGSRRGQAAVQVLGPPARTGGAAASPPPPPPGPGVANPLGGQPPGTGAAVALRIEPPTVYLLPSENTRVSPRALRADGAPAAPLHVTWKSLREDVVSVDPNGNVIALAPGQGLIQALAPGGLTATAPVVVQKAAITIAGPSPRVVSPGQTDTLRVVVPAQGAREVNPLQLQWASSDPNVVRVNHTGIITAVATGRATLAVRGLLQSHSVDVTVHRPVELLVVRPRASGDLAVALGGRQRFEAEALAADNAAVPEAPLRWMVTDTSIATFDPTTGFLTGRTVGRTQLTVRGPGQGLAVTWNVSVLTGSLRLAQPRVGLALNEHLALRAGYVDSAGAALAPAVGLTWISDRPDIAPVSTEGTVTGAGYGRARVIATAPGGQTDTGTVFVQGEILVASTRTDSLQLYSVERANLAQLHRVTDASATAYDPAYSPDASRIAFVSNRDGNPEIYLMDADGRNALRLTHSPGADGHPVFTPDGQSVVFHSSRTGNRQIWSVGIDGSRLRQLTQEPASNQQPTVSPDGSTIAFSSAHDGTYDIWLMASDGSQQRQFTKSMHWKETYPAFLRDGSLAYLVERQEGTRAVTQVYKADLVSGRATPLTGTDLQITSFAIAPGGDLLALVVPVPGTERRTTTHRVYVQPVGAGGPVPIPATGDEQIASPTFQP